MEDAACRCMSRRPYWRRKAQRVMPQGLNTDSTVSTANQYKSDFESAKGNYGKTAKIGEGFVQNVSARDVMLKVYKSINLCLPRNDGERPKEITERNEISIEDIECVYFDKLEDWYGKDKGDQVKHAEAFEICEYGSRPDKAELARLFPFFDK